MSRVYWHTRDHGEAEVRGSERAYGHLLARDIAFSIAVPAFRAQETLEPVLIGPPAYLMQQSDGPAWTRDLRMWLGQDGKVMLDGEAAVFSELALNTLIVMSRPLRLLAWMHGLCERHGYFEPSSHDALAETIREGREDNILRADVGWESVLDLIDRVDGSGPIVWSYSVSEPFPDRWELRPPREPDESQEDYERRTDRYLYDELSAEDAWDQCIALLREKPWPVALHPDIEQGFSGGKTAFDFAARRTQALAKT